MNVGKSLLNLLYPDDVVCHVCGCEAVLDADGVCEPCRAGLMRAPADILCPPELDGLSAGLIYNETIEPAMHRFKYKRQVWLAPFFADYMDLPGDWTFDSLVPVPLHPLREWQRSYNQSELLAQAMVKRTHLSVRCDLVRRTRYTRQQAKLTAAERAVNLEGAFMANTRAAGLSVVLVDDVTTTHSTLVSCAQALRHAGAVRVYAVCACVAGYDAHRR